jgi:hypothetical protein
MAQPEQLVVKGDTTLCDAVSLAIASTVIGTVGTAMSSMGAMRAQKQQERNVHAWQQEQNRNREAEQLRQEQLRQSAEVERQKGLKDISAQDQSRRQAEEEARLASYYKGETGATGQPEAAISEADRVAAQASAAGSNDPAFRSDLAANLNAATREAKARLGALAGISSFGGTPGGLALMNPILQQQSGGAIDMFNEFRRGSLGAYGLEKAIDPVQVSYSPSPLAQGLQTLGQVGMSFAGSGALGGGAGQNIVPNIGGATVDPWKNLRNLSLPGTAPIPTPRPVNF